MKRIRKKYYTCGIICHAQYWRGMPAVTNGTKKHIQSDHAPRSLPLGFAQCQRVMKSRRGAVARHAQAKRPIFIIAMQL
jgi:hypothetical protein